MQLNLEHAIHLMQPALYEDYYFLKYDYFVDDKSAKLVVDYVESKHTPNHG